MKYVKLSSLSIIALLVFSLNLSFAQSATDAISIDLGRQLFVDDYLIENTDLEIGFSRDGYDWVRSDGKDKETFQHYLAKM